MAEQFRFVLERLLHEAAADCKNQFSRSGGPIFAVMFTDDGMEETPAPGLNRNEDEWSRLAAALREAVGGELYE